MPKNLTSSDCLYSIEIDDEVYKAFKELSKKDRKQLEAINKKINQILTEPSQFKPLKHPLDGLRRVHIISFVLMFEIKENDQTVRILKYTHHDQAYL